jgi:hypothetical protein
LYSFLRIDNISIENQLISISVNKLQIPNHYIFCIDKQGFYTQSRYIPVCSDVSFKTTHINDAHFQKDYPLWIGVA